MPSPPGSALREGGDAGLPPERDEEWYRREVLPKLAGVKVKVIMEAAGCPKSYASVIRCGRYVPHVSTWKAPGSRRPVRLRFSGSAFPLLLGGCAAVLGRFGG